jgi:hypothetical protein
MPVSASVLDAPTAHASPPFDCVRSEPPVATKLMLPVKRAKRVIAVCCASAAKPTNANAATAHPASSRDIDVLIMYCLPCSASSVAHRT